MRPPPWLDSAQRQARRRGPDGEAAEREARRWDRMREYGAGVVAALDGASIAGTDDAHGLTPSGIARVAVVGVQLGDGAVVACPDARALREDWTADPARAHAAVSRCASAWALRPHRDGQWRAGPLSCDCSLCPMCVSARIAQQRREWTHELRELVAAGHHLVLVTRTRPADVAPAEPVDVVWTAADADRWGPCPWPTHDAPGAIVPGVGSACPGETLGAAWDALATATRALQDARVRVMWRGEAIQRRDWWSQTVVASVDAIEATQVRTDDAGQVEALRWHVHGHALLVLEPGAILSTDTTTDDAGRVVLSPSCEWWRAYLASWRGEVAGALDPAQHAALISAADDVDSAIRETVKYPGKISEMTAAGVVEWLSTAKGRRPQRAGATLHAGTRRGRAARAARRLTELRDLEALGEQRAADEVRELLRAQLGDDAWAIGPEVAVGELHEALTERERRHAEAVTAACVSWDRAERLEQALHGWQGDVYQAPREELDELVGAAPGERRLLTWERLGELLRAGLRSVDDLVLCRHGEEPEALGRVELRAVRRAVSTWRPRRGRDGP